MGEQESTGVSREVLREAIKRKDWPAIAAWLGDEYGGRQLDMIDAGVVADRLRGSDVQVAWLDEDGVARAASYGTLSRTLISMPYDYGLTLFLADEDESWVWIRAAAFETGEVVSIGGEASAGRPVLTIRAGDLRVTVDPDGEFEHLSPWERD